MVRIVADSTCDLSTELVEKNKIEIVPLHIVLGEKEYLDGVDITPDAIYEWAEQCEDTPKTSAVGFEDAIATLKHILEIPDWQD